MKTLVQQLENESLLLLYMAGELPPCDRAELELLLSRDGGLRAQMESLRAAESASFAALAQLDASEHLRAVEPAMRQVDRSMLQWQIDRMARPAKATSSASMMPIWGWSVSAAVAAVLVFCIWWGFRGDDSHVIVATQPMGAPVSPNDAFAMRSSRSLGDSANAVGAIPDANPGAVSVNPDGNPGMVQMVTVDSERIGDLERQVSDDVQ